MTRQRRPDFGPTEPNYDTLTSRLEILFSKNAAAIDELRGVVSEAHGVLRDLRKEIRKAEQIGPAIVTKRLRHEAQRAIEELGEATAKAIQNSAEKVTSEFNALEQRLLGSDEPGKKSLPDMLDQLGPMYPILCGILNGELIVTGSEKEIQITRATDSFRLRLDNRP